MKTIVVILAAVQILHSSGQSLTKAVDDSINKLNEDSTSTYLLTVTRYELSGVTLTDEGLQVNLTLDVQETNCSEGPGVFLAEGAPLPSDVTERCTSTLSYANCMMQNVEITCADQVPLSVAILNLNGSSTSAPMTPVPTTPVPTTPAPMTPVPTIPVPTTPVPTTPAPMTPVPTTPAPMTPVPTIPTPTTPVPTTPASTTPVPTTPAPTIPTPTTTRSSDSNEPANSGSKESADSGSNSNES